MTKRKVRGPELDVVSKELIKRLPGFAVRRAPSHSEEDSYVAVTLSYRADPSKDNLKWITRQIAKMPDMRAVRREYLLDWTSAEGSAFYPSFADAPENYVDEKLGAFVQGSPVFRGYDFGFRHPAAVWVQVRPSGRLAVLHDLLPADIDTFSFRDLVLYLSGQSLEPGTEYDPIKQLRLLEKRPRAYEYAVNIRKNLPWWGPAGPLVEYPVPFFPPGTDFYDFSGPEAYKVAAQVEGNKGERTDAEVFASAGINLDCAWQAVAAGETLLRKTMLTRDDDIPGIICHPSAVNTINALGGGVVYAKSTPANPRPDTAQKDGLFEHIHDALRYVATHVVDASDSLPQRNEPSQYREQEDYEAHLRGEDEEGPRPYESEIDWTNLDEFC